MANSMSTLGLYLVIIF
ncbi:hypothetical protein LOS07_16135, partial [Proteus mirabilis]|nr:hypothetical protein [Proteus mirabilis]